MLITRGIRTRFVNYVTKKSKGMGIPEDKFVESVLKISKTSYAMIQQGEVDPSLALCERLIRDGCDPHYLFFGEFNKCGDPVKCFSAVRNRGCKYLDVESCPGYDKCRFYKSEARIIAENMSAKNAKWGIA